MKNEVITKLDPSMVQRDSQNKNISLTTSLTPPLCLSLIQIISKIEYIPTLLLDHTKILLKDGGGGNFKIYFGVISASLSCIIVLP